MNHIEILLTKDIFLDFLVFDLVRYIIININICVESWLYISKRMFIKYYILCYFISNNNNNNNSRVLSNALNLNNE